jgi:hypothetical protein
MRELPTASLHAQYVHCRDLATKKAKGDHMYRPHQRTGHAQYCFSLMSSCKILENPCSWNVLKLQTLPCFHQPHSNEIHGDNWKVWCKVISGCSLPLILFLPGWNLCYKRPCRTTGKLLILCENHYLTVYATQ